MRRVYFERAIFLSWYCAKPECTFCYMSTIQNQITDPRKARRRKESVLAETAIAKACNWKIEFLSGGIHSYSTEELLEITTYVSKIMGEKQWLNMGVMSRKQLESFLPLIKGVTGTVECINPALHNKVCPAKPLADVEQLFSVCDDLGLKKGMTLIVGLGETKEDIPLLIDFIKKHSVDRITFYRLVPHPGTPFTDGPTTEYYTTWIKETRKRFPELDIIAGTWQDKIEEIPALLEAGANALTKFQGIKLFGSDRAKIFESLVKEAGYECGSSFTRLNKTKLAHALTTIPEPLQTKVRDKLDAYLKKMER